MRSLITVTSLVLAIAFFCFVNVGTDVANGLLATGDDTGLREALIQNGYDIQTGSEPSSTTLPNRNGLWRSPLLVCVVGIVNAQLMAVTERFREIGTMKCLGALNRFISQALFAGSRHAGTSWDPLVGALFLGALFAPSSMACLRYRRGGTFADSGMERRIMISIAYGLPTRGALCPESDRGSYIRPCHRRAACSRWRPCGPKSRSAGPFQRPVDDGIDH